MANTILIFILLLSLSALFSAIEISFFSLSHGKARTMVRQGLFGAKLVEKLKQKPRRLLITILIGNNLVNVFAAAIATQLALSYFGSNGVAIATGVVTFLILVFGEIFPKSFAQQHPGTTSRYTAFFIYTLTIILSPVAWCLEKTMDIFITKKQQSASLSTEIAEEEINSLFQIGHEKGLIEEHEKEFVKHLFKFNDKSIAGIMNPIEKAFMLDGGTTIEHTFDQAVLSGYSRFPVFKENKNNIIGIAHIKDIMRADYARKGSDTLDIIVQPPLVVHSNEKLDDMFRLLVKNQTHFALVKDPTNMIIGFVTLEDIIEELVGEIYDESDKRKKGIIT